MGGFGFFVKEKTAIWLYTLIFQPIANNFTSVSHSTLKSP